MTTGWEVSEWKGRQRPRRGETDTRLAHWSLESLFSPEKVSGGRTSQQFLSLPGVLHVLCACMFVRAPYVNTAVGESVAVIVVQSVHWESGCMRLCRIFCASALVKDAIHISVCKSSSCLWLDFEVCVTGLPSQDHSLVRVWITLAGLQGKKTHCVAHTGAHARICTCLRFDPVQLFFFFFFHGYQEISNDNKGLFSWISSGHPLKDRETAAESRPHLATIWAACTLLSHYWKLLGSFIKKKDLYLHQILWHWQEIEHSCSRLMWSVEVCMHRIVLFKYQELAAAVVLPIPAPTCCNTVYSLLLHALHSHFRNSIFLPHLQSD